MVRRVPYPDDETQPVIVPQNECVLVPTSPERIHRLREHLERLVTALKPDGPASTVRTAPEGFAARVADTACALCQGWCCRGGEDDGFLDEATLARLPSRLATAAEVVELYVRRVPDAGYENSCIFHGATGCTLDRSMRSDVCNAYFCNGLHAFLSSAEAAGPTIIISGKLDRMRLSDVLVP